MQVHAVGNHLFPLRVLQKMRVINYPNSRSVHIVGGTITPWRIALLFIQRNVPNFKREKTMEANIGALEERFKTLASPSTSGTKASSSTQEYYMFGASWQVVSSASVTCAQTVLLATPTTTREFVDNLQAHDNGPADQIDQIRLPLSFGLADTVQSISGRNSSF